MQIIRKKEKKRRIIDIHSHVLFGVDDGPEDIEESITMLEIAEKNGISDIICTPHFKEYQNPLSKEEIIKVFKELEIRKTIYQINVDLHLGNEVLFTNGILDKTQTFFTLNNSDYILVEFDPKAGYTKIINDLQNLRRLGLSVVLAHVERYEAVISDLKHIKEIKDLNILIQVNANSIIDKKNKDIYNIIHKMLKKKYVDFVSTDAHSSYIRTPEINETVLYLYKKYDEKYVDDILYGNAIKYLGV